MDGDVDPATLTWAAKFSNVPAADPGAARDPNAGQTSAGDPSTGQAPAGDPPTAPQPLDPPAAQPQGEPSASLPAPFAATANGDPGAAPDPNQAPASGTRDPPATNADAPKKINVTIKTSYGQAVRYWMQDRATDANNEAPEGSGTVLIDGDEHGPGESISLSCIATANGASICYQRESNTNPPGGGMTPWSSVTIGEGDTFTIQETAQPLGDPPPSDPIVGQTAGDPTSGQAPADPVSGAPPRDPPDPNAATASDPNGATDPGAAQPGNSGSPAQTGDPGTTDPSNISMLTLSKGAPHPDDLTDDPAWQTGYDAGFANPEASVAPQVSYPPRSAEAFDAGVKAGQQAAKQAKSSTPAGTDPADKPSFANSAFQKLYDDAIAAARDVSPNQVAALKSLDSGKSGPWKTLSWSTIAVSSASRILKPSLINQATLNVCGSAAALEGEAAQNATGYADEVIEVFSKGTLKGKSINPKLFTSAPVSGMDAGDWMMLSSAQDVVNAIRSFDGTVEDGAAGTLDYNDRKLLDVVDDAKDSETLGATLGREASSSRKVVDLLSKHGDKVTIIASCNAEMLFNDGAGVDTGKEDHDVRLLGLDYGSTVKFKFYSWGKEWDFSWPQDRYNKWIYGYEIGTRDASIELP